MRITNHVVAALSSLVLAIVAVDGSPLSTAINVDNPYIFLGGQPSFSNAPTAAPTPAPTTVDSSIVCPEGNYGATIFRSADCTKAGVCNNGNLELWTILECAEGQIYNVNCDGNTYGFAACCTSNASVTCPTPSPTSSPTASPPVSFICH